MGMHRIYLFFFLVWTGQGKTDQHSNHSYLLELVTKGKKAKARSLVQAKRQYFLLLPKGRDKIVRKAKNKETTT